MSLMHSLSFIPVITRPTRITEHCGSIIDNIFITKPNSNVAGNVISSLSVHLPNFVIHKNLIHVGNTNNSSFTHKIRPLSDENMEDLFVHFSAHDFSGIANCNNVNAAVVELSYIIMNYLNVFCPIKTKIIFLTNLKLSPGLPTVYLTILKSNNLFIYCIGKAKCRGNLLIASAIMLHSG